MLLALVFLLGALVSSGALVAKHFFNTALPGCGAQSACSQLEAHPMGSLGGMVFTTARMLRGEAIRTASIDGAASTLAPVPTHERLWPVSFLGFALYAGLHVALLVSWRTSSRSGQPLTSGLVWIARVSALASLVFLVVIVLSGKYCPYCIATHAMCLGFWMSLEIAVKRSRAQVSDVTTLPGGWGRFRPLAAGAAAFVLASMALGAAESAKESERRSASTENLNESLNAIVQQSGGSQQGSVQTPPAPVAPAPGSGPEGFTGRWRFGPEEASIRLVVYSSYQCVDCKRVEEEIFSFMEKNPNVKVSLTAKHFPMSNKCNKYIGADMHPNSCWAARAAETAGKLKGNDGFWQMHRWLFSVSGSFTDAELPAQLQKLGYTEPQAFISAMQTPQMLAPIESDIEEANALGLYFTPLVFVNGVELRGWESPGAVTRALTQLASQNLPAATAKNDRPPLATKKVVEDWKLGFQRPMPDDIVLRAIGASEKDAKATIVVWGDYQEPNTRKVDQAIRAAMADRPWLRYVYRHFPTASECNPQMGGKIIHPSACLAARAAESAGNSGGSVAYWALHDWLMKNPRDLDEDKIRQAAQAIGLDAEAVIKGMSESKVDSAIGEDAAGAGMLQIRSIPFVFLDGKQVFRWELAGQDLLAPMIDEAGKD
jgi:protein-disulfide isomerase